MRSKIRHAAGWRYPENQIYLALDFITTFALIELHLYTIVKLKVLNTFLLNCLLYNVETFGERTPEGLESTYMDMLK